MMSMSVIHLNWYGAQKMPTIELTTPEINKIKEKFSRLVLISDIKNLYFFDTHLTSIQ